MHTPEHIIKPWENKNKPDAVYCVQCAEWIIIN